MRRPRGETFTNIEESQISGGQEESAMAKNEQEVMEAARRAEMEQLWEKYRFPGNPPPKGSIAEQRIFSTAKDYIDCASGATAKKQTASDVLRHASELDQRVLHNQLSLMIFGVERSQMPKGDSRANQLSDFAAGITFPGETLDSIYNKTGQ